MDMVEKVARALCDDTLKRWRSPLGVQSEPWREFIPAARAAIEALREPTDAMRDAFDDSAVFNGMSAFREEWANAIDAALTPSPAALNPQSQP